MIWQRLIPNSPKIGIQLKMEIQRQIVLPLDLEKNIGGFAINVSMNGKRVPIEGQPQDLGKIETALFVLERN